jgi:hypothetical protein
VLEREQPEVVPDDDAGSEFVDDDHVAPTRGTGGRRVEGDHRREAPVHR